MSGNSEDLASVSPARPSLLTLSSPSQEEETMWAELMDTMKILLRILQLVLKAVFNQNFNNLVGFCFLDGFTI